MDSNRRRMFINRADRRVSLRRPANQRAALNQEIAGAAAARRRFQERSTSVDVSCGHK